MVTSVSSNYAYTYLCIYISEQHEASTRNVDKNVWDEICNFKKCLILMFAKQDKEVVFIETVTELAQQRRHCSVECIPLPQAIAKQAPIYFKKVVISYICLFIKCYVFSSLIYFLIPTRPLSGVMTSQTEAVLVRDIYLPTLLSV